MPTAMPVIGARVAFCRRRFSRRCVALWLAGSAPEAIRFRRTRTHVRHEQECVLLGLLRDNADTEFGRRHRFSRIASVRAYQELVPLATYETYRAEIDRIATPSPTC
jgi:GH3 auxin-responsive promoter